MVHDDDDDAMMMLAFKTFGFACLPFFS